MPATQKQKILLINNKSVKFENLSALLKQLGYAVLTAEDGREGFRLMRRESPALVISEIDVSASEFCRIIRADRQLWATPLVFVSESNLDSRILTEILDAGADDCLAEFSNPQHLAAKSPG